MGKRLYVGNLSFSITEADLREAFKAEGHDVSEVKLVTDRETGRPRGFAFVEMATDEGAAHAIGSLNGRDLQGRTITVSEARERTGGGVVVAADVAVAAAAAAGAGKRLAAFRLRRLFRA